MSYLGKIILKNHCVLIRCQMIHEPRHAKPVARPKTDRSAQPQKIT